MVQIMRGPNAAYFSHMPSNNMAANNSASNASEMIAQFWSRKRSSPSEP
jgi:hypothetical protein